MRKIFGTSMVAAMLVAAAPAAHASLITFDLNYSGSVFANLASATGTITFDDAVLPNPGTQGNVTAAAIGVTAFSITVAGAAAGNGSFGLANVTNWVWVATSPLDLTTELVGQAGFNDFNWCAVAFSGCTAPAPGGIAPFTISANAETSDRLQLVSMKRTAVPEPATLGLISLGLFGIAAFRRRV